MAEKETKDSALYKKISHKRESAWLKFSEKQKKEAFSFSEGYKKFMKISKTERLFVENAMELLKKNGFKDMEKAKHAKKGDKLFWSFKNKTLIAFIVGKDPKTFRLVGSHIDSPRLDLKPLPLYEDSGFAILKSHYYGGIKKYHWVNVPLALHGVIFTKSGKKVNISIGEKEDEPVFDIPDLLPHLAKKQMEKSASKVVEGEELNIFVGNLPVADKKIKDKVKYAILKKLHKDYGIIEEDFAASELEFVPATNPRDVGFDRSMVGAYAQDDKVCAYTSMMALLNVKSPKNTAVAFFADKEEIGSTGDTGASSLILKNFAYAYKKLMGLKIDVSEILSKSKAISADVTSAMNPNYKDANDSRNVSYLSHGVSVEKYNGSGGKYMGQDATAEYFAEIRALFDKNKIPWQTGEIGKIDMGGGGTIGIFLARYGMDCIDIGPCLLAMHSPFEVASKADIYSAYLFYKVFMEA